MLAALVAIPVLIHRMADARFGFLSIAWVLVGYVSLFDLGVGRALTHAVASRWAKAEHDDAADLISTALLALIGFGILAGLALSIAAPWIVSAIEADDALRREALAALRVLGLAVPFTLLTAGLRGLLEARQAFRAINLALLPAGVLMYLGPALVSSFSPELPYVIAALVGARVLATLALMRLCADVLRSLPRFRVTRPALRELLSFGGWMTVSNTVSPIMVNMDRIFIGAYLSLATVTYYVTPFEVTTKLLVLSGAIAAASFPEFSRLAGLRDTDGARRYLMTGSVTVLAVMLPVVAIAAFFSHEILSLWVSPALADRSSGIMRWLAAGVLANGLASIPFAYIQGKGRADVTAKFHLAELVLYLPLLYLLLSSLGVLGAAIAWALRVTLDAALLFGYAAFDLRRAAAAPVPVRS